MWSALPTVARQYIYAHELPLHVAHIDATEYDLPEREVRVAGIARRGDETLFVKSAKDQRDWELPGGRLESDESPDEAVTREFEEETGLQACSVTPLLAMVWAFPDSTIIQLVFEVEHGEVIRDPVDEISDTDWFAELPGDISFGDDGHATYEFIVNSESVEVQVPDGPLQTLFAASPSRKTSIAVAGVAGGAAVTAGLARRLLSNRDGE